MKQILNLGLLLILTLVIAWGVKAFVIPGFYTSHDGETHTARLANYYLALQEGQFPPQLAPTLFGGFGFPIFIFIYPLPYLLGAFFHSLGFTYTDSAEAVMALGHIISGVLFYLFIEKHTGSKVQALVSSLFFSYAPYRFLMLFVRGAYAESLAYVFVSASFLALWWMGRQPTVQKAGILSLSLAGMLLSHQLVSVMFLPILAWYWLWQWPIVKSQRQYLTSTAFAVVLAGLMASFIYLPAVMERSATRFDEAISYTNDHFVTLRQLIRSPWSYGFSHSGTLHDDMSFQIGLAHLLVVGLALMVLVLSYWWMKGLAWKRSEVREILWWLVPFVVSVILMIESPVSKAAFELLPGLSYLDFPWRLLGVVVVSVAFMIPPIVSLLHNPLPLTVLLIAAVLVANRNHLRINQTVEFSDEHFEHYPATATWLNEFLPEGRVTNRWEGIEGEYHIESGQAQITNHRLTTTVVDLTITPSSPTRIILHRMYFPGWSIIIDGQKTPFGSPQASIVTNSTLPDYSSFLAIELSDPRPHRVQAVFSPTPIRQVGYSASLLGLVMALAAVQIKRRNEST